MEGLIKQAEQFKRGTFPNDFMHYLNAGLSLTSTDKILPYLKPEAIRVAEYLRDAFMVMRDDLKAAGKIRCWHFRRKRIRKFSIKIAQLAGRLKQAAD